MTQFHGGRLAGQPTEESIQAQLDRLTEIVNSEVSFGHPHHPVDPSLNYPAGTAVVGDEANQHNGVIDNFLGSWVEILITTTGRSSHTCTHNLYANAPEYTLPVAGEPNCRWLNWGIMHDGTNVGAGTKMDVTVSYVKQAASPTTANDINLTFEVIRAAAPNLTIDATHPIRVTLFFIPAIRRQ